MRRHLMLALSLAATTLACGDDNTANCGAGTVLQNGACVPATTSSGDTSSDTGTAQDSTTTTATTNPTTTPDVTQDTTVTPDVSNECTAEEAGKGGVGAPCTKNCQCNQALKGKALTCYSGPYMQGFSFCTREADGTLNEGDGVETLKYVSSCFQPAGVARFNDIYVKGCTSLADCQAISTAYDECGTAKADFPWSTSDGVTDCPYWSTQGYCGASSMVLKKTCLVSGTPPFDQSYVTGHTSCQ
ncbi:MAG: hypothetical protein U1F43_27815 [Myxococcota bacterium]